jgi:hypothetical protein
MTRRRAPSAVAQLREVLERPEEDLLRTILGLRVAAGHAGGRREDHVLIRTHKGRELD